MESKTAPASSSGSHGGYDPYKPLWSPSDVTYTSCYCEENVWQLCDSLRRRSLSVLNPTDATHARHALEHSYAVFISNDTKSVALWSQKSAKGSDDAVIWDYHVIFIHAPSLADAHVYDHDSSLGWHIGLSNYLSNTFLLIHRGAASARQIQASYRPQFRVIRAMDYLTIFASDRSHMLKPAKVSALAHQQGKTCKGNPVQRGSDASAGLMKDGDVYFRTPPVYAPIRTTSYINTLPLLWLMSKPSLPTPSSAAAPAAAAAAPATNSTPRPAAPPPAEAATPPAVDAVATATALAIATHGIDILDDARFGRVAIDLSAALRELILTAASVASSSASSSSSSSSSASSSS